MDLIACGLNHKTAPLALRERLFFGPEQMPAPLLDLTQQSYATEAAILSTCNRTEVYCHSQQASKLLDWLCARHAFSPTELRSHLYFHQDADAVRHIMRVAAGLDSMVLGEPQILGQLKQAYALAQAAGTLGPRLQRLFQHVFATTKEIRTYTAIGICPVSIVFTAIHLARQLFSDFTPLNVLLIGAGATVALALKYLNDHQINQVTIANRSIANAKDLARNYAAKVITLDAVPDQLANVDIVIAATAASAPVLAKNHVERALAQRQQKPMLMLDLAVPRDIEAGTANLKGVHLYTIDDMQFILEKNQQRRQHAAEQAEKIIRDRVDDYMRQARSLAAVNTIRAYRDKIVTIREGELAKAQHALAQGKTATEVMADLARHLTRKIMHGPTVQLRQAASSGEVEVISAARQLLGLDDDEGIDST